MVTCIRVPLAEAEKVKRLLHEKGLFHDGYRYEKEDGFILFPVKEAFETSLGTFEERELERLPKKQDLKERLSEALSDEEREHLTRSFDTVGSIAIIEIAEELQEKERLIGEAILENHKSITTVLKKLGGHEGELRLQRYRCIAGIDTRETLVRENGVTLKIDVEGVYYSVRSATERKRIAQLVQPGERVLVMFSGAGPYVCVIAKLTAAAEVVGIELNERGHELAVENAQRNKLDNVTLIQGDVQEVSPQLAGSRFDRIVMPLPHTGEDFLDEAFLLVKEGGVIHLYDFEPEGEFEKAAEKARAGAERNGWEIKVLGITPSGQHSPRLYRVCVDVETLKKA